MCSHVCSTGRRRAKRRDRARKWPVVCNRPARPLGGTGRDTLTGGPGADVLTGGADNDMFVFYAGQGTDQITDFELGRDLLNLRAFHFSDAAAAVAAFSQTAEGALFAVGATSILLTGIDWSDLTGSSLLI